MFDNNKSYRIRTEVAKDSFVSVNLEQDYDCFDILSLKINGVDEYKKHNSKYGVVVGRVLANNGFGVPNAKISIFIASENPNADELNTIYPFRTQLSKDNDGIAYNLLLDEQVSDCHQVVGTFPNKRFMLDNNILVEVFDKYYKYTTKTNNSGDYMLCCIPVGEHTLHMDVDLSDCGILSQRPRDFVYKGYSIEQFENPNQFKSGTEYSTLSQVFSQNQVVYVQPFWGNESLGETIGITRADISIAYKFEPTCVFIGSIISDNASQGISKNCVPTPHMGDMDELVSGKGRIEMIRKTYAGSVEEFQINGTELINGDGIWCYQIPMNLDYMATDEYGNMVPTDDPEKGIPTRARVRFRVSMEDMEENTDNFFRAKILVPHNPQNTNGTNHEDYDYEFGTYTRDESFRDLFWNNVYTVKSYIPRFQKRKTQGWKATKFTGIKHCQDYGSNNPMPYNNIRIKLPFMFIVMCILIKVFIKLVAIYNRVVAAIGNTLCDFAEIISIFRKKWANKLVEVAKNLHLNVIEDGLCPDLENWYFTPLTKSYTSNSKYYKRDIKVKDENGDVEIKTYDLINQTMDTISSNEYDDNTSIDTQNNDPNDNDDAICITFKTDYLISCVEMNLAQEYKVINFDFYNDWVNGVLYFPRWMRYVKSKRSFKGSTIIKSKVKGCMDDTKVFSKARKYTQLCSLAYTTKTTNGHVTFSNVKTKLNNEKEVKLSNNYHKKSGFSQVKIFGKNGGICHSKETMAGQHVYYLKPCEWTLRSNPANIKINLFATDLVLLGSLNECDIYGVPQAFKYLSSTSYIMPTNLALTNMETDSQLYAYGDNGMICSQNNQSTMDGTDPNLNRPVSVTDNTLTSELHYFSGAPLENYDTNFEGDEYDTIPMTEAAGISWNYSGPGQGEIKKSKMYYPGGHFLGLSCLRSQTNIKSCINLERICEQGVSMSQRRIDVRAVTNDIGNELKYVYTVPSGFIAKDEVIDESFRTMFATMNQNRLIATKFNPNNGYKVYDFKYVNPVNFGGEFSILTHLSQSPYNSDITIADESSSLNAYNIASATTRDDFDPQESTYTQTRTIEDTSVDYYRFRFGLDYSDLTNNSIKHKRKYGIVKTNKMYLPQYENSYYFYFGLRAGATAIDEFNKQFFSECETHTLISKNPTVKVNGDFDLCQGVGTISVLIENMEPQYVYNISNGIASGITDDTYFTIENVPCGEYTITVRDFNGIEITNNVVIGLDLIQGVLTAENFNMRINEPLVRDEDNMNLFYGGAVVGEELYINSATIIQSIAAVKSGDDISIPSNIEATANTINRDIIFNEEKFNTSTLYLSSANTDYDIYVRYMYMSCPSRYMYMGTISLADTSDCQLNIGAAETYDFEYAVSGSTGSPYTYGWWADMNHWSSDSGGTNTLRKWNVLKALSNQVCTSAETHSNCVNGGNGGDKIVFGSPQNMFGIYEQDNQLYVGGYYEPNGFTVNDDYSYYPTYGTSDYNLIHQYNTMSFTDNGIYGSFAAIVSGQSGTVKSLIPIFAESSKLRTNDGCLFKELPSGVIYPAKYSGNTIYILGDADDVGDYGIVYPTVVYPSLKRPFSVNMDYVYVTRVVVSEQGVKHYTIDARCEGQIKNGVTFKGYYSGKSNIDFINGDDTLPNSVKIKTNRGDLYGLTESAQTPRITYIVAHSTLADYLGEQDSDAVNISDMFDRDTSASFNIIEGYPCYKDENGYYQAYNGENYTAYENAYRYENVAESRSLDMTANFYSNIKYSGTGIDNNYYFAGVGYADDDIEYYLLNKRASGSPMVFHAAVNNESFIYSKIEDDNGYGKLIKTLVYTSANTQAYIELRRSNIIDPITFMHFCIGYYYKNGEEVKVDTGLPHIYWDTTWSDDIKIKENLSKLIDKANDDGIGIDKNKSMTYLFNYDTLEYGNPNLYKDYVLNQCTEDRRIVNGEKRTTILYPYIVATKRFYSNDGLSTGSISVIYETPFQSTRPINENEKLK